MNYYFFLNFKKTIKLNRRMRAKRMARMMAIDWRRSRRSRKRERKFDADGNRTVTVRLKRGIAITKKMKKWNWLMRRSGGGWWGYFSLPEVKDGNDTEREVFPLLYRMIQKEKCFLCYIDDVTCWIFISVYFLYGRWQTDIIMIVSQKSRLVIRS